jgi:hypothetical protein
MGGRGNQTISSVRLLDAVIATGAGALHTPAFHEKRTFQATGQTTAGAGAATILVQVSSVGTPTADGDWVTLGTITLTLSTTRSTDGITSDAPWRHVRGNVSAISGTNAAVTLWMGA